MGQFGCEEYRQPGRMARQVEVETTPAFVRKQKDLLQDLFCWRPRRELGPTDSNLL